MRPLRSVRSLWASVRPRTRRGWVLVIAGLLATTAALSVALFVGAAMAWSPYVTFDLDRVENVRAWAAIQPEFAGSATCVECHARPAAVVAGAPHAAVACESCHTALAGHIEEAGAKPAYALGPLPAPTNADCLRCHEDAVGRPSGLATIDVAQHYRPVCLDCHDPHSSKATRPPVVRHPLDNLPPCFTCHGPEGFMARNIRHPSEATDDVACLSCHAKGRGPGAEDNR